MEHDGLFQGVMLPWRCLARYRLGRLRHFLFISFLFFFLPPIQFQAEGGEIKKKKKAALIRQRGQMGDRQRERESVINGFVHNADVRGTDEQEKWPSNEGKE